MSAKTHNHKYIRARLGKDKKYIVYKCALPDCTHFVQRELAVGRKSICWKCENIFILEIKDLMLAKPVCCKGKKKERMASTELLKRMGIKIK